MKKANLILFSLYVAASISWSVLKMGVPAAIFVLSFALVPMAINFLMSQKIASNKSQVILFAVSLLYMCWFSWAILDSFYRSRDAQAGLVILFAFIYALPILIVGWILSAVFSSNKPSHNESLHRTAK